MAIDVVKGKFPHVGWADIKGDGTLHEVAMLTNGPQGLFFIQLNILDAIDKQRLFRVISNRNSNMYELWDLMSNITLGNGANALDYFHQYVKVLTPSGTVINPTMGRMAAPDITGIRTSPGTAQVAAMARAEKAEALNESAPKAAPRKRGRPAKKK